ncbi:MAG: hypothetical protein A2Y40_09805 [Candidatus Margulisbacteria bacterium GWF2_35_9]|nr:MAG: hypothetical protein A2Y40_09805 [Candidatus Margulisbacteria bacterium GWF2_35_9]
MYRKIIGISTTTPSIINAKTVTSDAIYWWYEPEGECSDKLYQIILTRKLLEDASFNGIIMPKDSIIRTNMHLPYQGISASYEITPSVDIEISGNHFGPKQSMLINKEGRIINKWLDENTSLHGINFAKGQMLILYDNGVVHSGVIADIIDLGILKIEAGTRIILNENGFLTVDTLKEMLKVEFKGAINDIYPKEDIETNPSQFQNSIFYYQGNKIIFDK